MPTIGTYTSHPDQPIWAQLRELQGSTTGRRWTLEIGFEGNVVHFNGLSEGNVLSLYRALGNRVPDEERVHLEVAEDF